MSCRYFGISRQAYYTWYRRYQAEGIEGLRARSKAPKHSPNATHAEVVGKIIYLRQNYHFGPEKISMYPQHYHDVTISKSGVWRILDRLGIGPPAGLTAVQATRPPMEAVREATPRPPRPDRREVRQTVAMRSKRHRRAVPPNRRSTASRAWTRCGKVSASASTAWPWLSVNRRRVRGYPGGAMLQRGPPMKRTRAQLRSRGAPGRGPHRACAPPTSRRPQRGLPHARPIADAIDQALRSRSRSSMTDVRDPAPLLLLLHPDDAP
ncbi:helix-turn-helix domain-containing protein [Streptomyces sp. NPDC056656]|uniref:helix-turn-helix domain-containing protein n=1 Tax=Streptomyces sp. NPDC056656 TaxID=3345895 RepID=UPI003699F61E